MCTIDPDVSRYSLPKREEMPEDVKLRCDVVEEQVRITSFL